ncbi:MAG TPA: hypothetical protein VIS06_10460 [Mycobacteriales bacterium]
MSEARRATWSGGSLFVLLALVVWRPGLPSWAWALVTVVTASVVAAVAVGMVRERRAGTRTGADQHTGGRHRAGDHTVVRDIGLDVGYDPGHEGDCGESGGDR